jgi:ribosomal protein S18 acetylase RimI-like enzyme
MADIDEIMALHREAFADKFGSAFGANGVERGLEAVAMAWKRHGRRALHGMLVAEWQQHIIGTITLRTAEINQDAATATEVAFHQALGLWGAIRSLFVLSLLSHRIQREEAFITDVAVHEPFRRQGTARKLLSHAEQEARARQKEYLALYVSKSNTGAIALYQNIGFSLTRVRRSWLTQFVFGQREWWYMRKDLLTS